MSADALLSRLDKVRRTGPETWAACCPAHDDRDPSLRIRQKPDGLVLVKCFAECSVNEIVNAVGMTLTDLFPARTITDYSDPKSHYVRRERRPFFPSDIFEIANREITIVAVIASDMHAQRQISELDYQRLLTAVGRLSDIAGAAYGKY